MHGSTRVPGHAFLAWNSSWRMVVYLLYNSNWKFHQLAAGQLLTGTVQKRQTVQPVPHVQSTALGSFSSGHNLQLSSSPSAMFLLFWSLIWLKKPPPMTFLLSNWPSTSKINTQKPGPALLGFSTFEFLPVLNGEAQVDCYFDVSRIECSCWSSELATSESGWNPWWRCKMD